MATRTTAATKKKTLDRLKTGSIASRLAKVIELREQARACYQEAEAIEAGLLDKIGVGKQYKLPDGRQVQLVDNFADKNKIWKSVGSTRFEFKIV